MKKLIWLLVVMMVLVFAEGAYADWTWTKGNDGVSVYYPSSGWTWTEGSDGHRVVYPLAGWTWTEGKNGRRIIYPLAGWTWTEGGDGQRLVYPLSGWTWTEGRDGQRLVYPLSGWTWTEGRDGHRIAFPTSGWTWREDDSGRRVAYPTSGDPYARPEDILYSLLLNKIPFTEALQPYSYLLVEQMGISYAGGAGDPELRRAHQMLNLNDITGARDLFRRLAGTGSTEYVRRDAAYMVGYCTAQTEDYWQSIQEYRDFISQYDIQINTRLIPDALYVLGVLYEHVGRKSDASDAYRSCIDRFPYTEVANQSRERLKVITGSRTAGVTAVSRAVFNTAPRRNPFETLKADRSQIARVCQFIYAVEKMAGVEEALEKLETDDQRLETVQRYQQLLSEKQQFLDLHQDAR